MPLRLELPVRTRQGFDRMAADLHRVFGERLVALVATGVHGSVLFTSSIAAGDLEALGPLVDAWSRDDLDPPLLLSTSEFQRSLDVFPVEYQALLDRHVVIAGEPPFGDITIDRVHLRQACEIQAKSHLIHLRQGWIEHVGRHDRLAALIVRSATPLRVLLADMARLVVDAEDADPMAGAAAARVDLDLVREIVGLEQAPERAARLVNRLPDYLTMSERLWEFVDTWPS